VERLNCVLVQGRLVDGDTPASKALFSPVDVQELLSALSASEARLRVAVEALGRITTGPGSIAGARDIARQALATIEGEGS